MSDYRSDAQVTPPGVAAIFVIDGRVIAHAACFNRSTPSGFTLAEAQEHRARGMLAWEVVKALASPALYSGLDTYGCERIVNSIKGGHVHVMQLGSPSSAADDQQGA